MQIAPAPIGLVFTGLGGLQCGLGIFDLVGGPRLFCELHVGPDRAQKLLNGAGINDRAIIAIEDTAIGHINCDILNRQEA